MKTLSVPLSKEAMSRLNYDLSVPGDLAEIEIAQSDFDNLWGLGLFTELNKQLDISIDEFEDEMIPAENICHALQILDEFVDQENENTPCLLNCLLNIGKLMKLAREKNTGIFMYF